MDKRNLIMDTYEKLLGSGLDKSTSIQDIATRANIAKGSLYYYFKDKEELLNAVVERRFGIIIDEAMRVAKEKPGRKIDQLIILLKYYLSQEKGSEMLGSLHEPSNAYVHEKSLKFIVLKLAEAMSEIIMEGNQAGEFSCEEPLVVSQVLLSSAVFLLDPGIFSWEDTEFQRRLAIILQLFFERLGLPSQDFQSILRQLNLFI